MSHGATKDFDRFVRNALSWGELQQLGRYRAGNRYANELERIGGHLRQDETGQSILMGLLEHPSPYVQIWAAKDCLSFSPKIAEPKLLAIAETEDSIANDAREVLAEWKRGRLFQP